MMTTQKTSFEPCCLCEGLTETKPKTVAGKQYPALCRWCFQKCVDTAETRRNKISQRLECRKKFIVVMKNAGIPELFAKKRVQSNQIQEISKIYTSNHMLFLWGDKAGTGKTTIAVELLKKALWRGILGLYVSAPAMITELRASFKSAVMNETEIIKKYSGIDVLIIDDIGVEKDSEYSLMCWYQVIDNRYSNQKKTICTSNYSLKEISEKLGNRIASRLSSGIVFKITGEDRRLRQTF